MPGPMGPKGAGTYDPPYDYPKDGQRFRPVGAPKPRRRKLHKDPPPEEGYYLTMADVGDNHIISVVAYWDGKCWRTHAADGKWRIKILGWREKLGDG